MVQFSGVSSTLFEEDPGIMSEVETVSTSGRRRQQQQQQQQQLKPDKEKHSLPIVRTPSKTLERPLGLVFLIYRGETKRALLPNEITSLDTVKALFVRSFGKQLTMEYMDTPRVKIYIHDSNKDIFYELENLTEIKDRTVLKLFEADSSGRGPCGLGPSGMPPITNSDELAALTGGSSTLPVTGASETDYVDSWHVKAMKALNRAQRESELLGSIPTRGLSSTLPRPPTSGSSSEASTRSATLGERSKTLGPGFLRGHRLANGSSLPGQQGMGGRVESGYVSSPDGNVEFESTLGRVLPISGRFSSGLADPRFYKGPESTEEAKERMMHMEAQLSQLTGMVERALKHKKMGKKTVSFDKSVTYSDDAPPQPTSILSNSAKRHQSQQHQVVRHHHNHRPQYHEDGSLLMDPALYNNLRGLQRSAKDLRQEVKVLKRLTQLQSMAMKDLVQDTYLKLREACIAFAMSQSGNLAGNSSDLELWRVAQDEEIFQKELNELVRSVSHLEAKVEETRSGVINKKNKINLSDVENMALVLSKSSKTVTQLKRAYPTLEANLRSSAIYQQQHQGDKHGNVNTSLLVTEDFLRRTPERLDNIWKRCKKLTGTLVTLKRLASVQEQRIHSGSNMDIHHMSLSPTPHETSRLPATSSGEQTKESTLDDLLDALQNYPGISHNHHHHHSHQEHQQQLMTASVIEKSKVDNSLQSAQSPLRRSADENARSQHVNGFDEVDSTRNIPPPAERKLSGSLKGAPPPPPPRTSSNKSSVSDDLAKSSSLDGSTHSTDPEDDHCLKKANSLSGPPVPMKPTDITTRARQDLLEVRHQELLQRQKQLQEQYQRLQDMQLKKSATSMASHKSQLAQQQQQLTQQHQQLKQLTEQQLKQLTEQQQAADRGVGLDTSAPNDSQCDDSTPGTKDQKQEQAEGTDHEGRREETTPKVSLEIVDAKFEDVKTFAEDLPFADSSQKESDSSSESTTASPEQNSESKKDETPGAPEVAPPPPPVEAVKPVPPRPSSNGKIPPEVPARRNKESTKVYHTEII